MNTTLYVTKAGLQIYDDAKQKAARHGLSLSTLVETLLDLATCPKAPKAFRHVVHVALRKARAAAIARRHSAVVSTRPKTKNVTYRHYGLRKDGTFVGLPSQKTVGRR